MMDLSQFHFLRPGWLLLLIPAAWLCWSMLRRQDPKQTWRGVIAEQSKTLVRSPRGIGKGEPKQIEILAFLKKMRPVEPYRANDTPPFIFRPTAGYEIETGSLKVLQSPDLAVPSAKAG